MSKYDKFAEYQRNVSVMVSREVTYCVSSLMSELIGKAECFPEYQEDLYSACEGNPDYEEAAQGECWNQSATGVFYKSPDNPGFYLSLWSDDTDSNYTAKLYAVTEPDQDNAPVIWEYSGRIDSAPCDLSSVNILEVLQAYLSESGVIPADSELFDCLDDLFTTSDAPDWQALCEEECIDSDDTRGEIYEYWIVSNWFGRKLSEAGEKVIDDIMGVGPIWCRGCTGQSISLDGVICGIYNETHKPESETL